MKAGPLPFRRVLHALIPDLDDGALPEDEIGWKSIRCVFPDHEDRTASATVSMRDGAYVCYGCGVKGDAYALIMHVEGVKFADAVDWARRQGLMEAGGSVRRPAREAYRPSWLRPLP